MIAIPNQPIVFPQLSNHNSLRVCSDASETEKIPALKVGWNDPLYFQWKRELSENPINCQLIEPNQGLEFIPDPELNDTSFLFIGSNWSVGSGEMVHTGSANDGFSYDMPIDSTKTYLVTIKVKDMGVGAVVKMYCGMVDPANGGADITDDGEYTQELKRNVGSSDVFLFRATNDATIEYLSIKEKVTENSCWTFADWTYSNTGLTHNQGETTPILLAMGSLIVGKPYKVVIKAKFSTGTCIVKSAFTTFGMLSSGDSIFYFTPSYDSFSLIPSEDFDGVIYSVDIREIDVFGEGQVVLVRDDDDGFGIDLFNNITYQKDWATLIFTPSEFEDQGIDTRCGYRLVFYSDGTHPIQYTSTVFEITTELDCLQLMRAWCDCEGWGFNFEVFRLQKRIELTWKVPAYEFEDRTQVKDNGYHERQFSRRLKSWDVVTSIDLSEVDHDNNSVMLHCDNLQIDGTSYFCDDKEYATNGDSEAKTVTSSGRFSLSLLEDAIYNRNCGCNNGEYALRVISGWGWSSYKRIDKFRFSAAVFQITFRVSSIIIDGVEILEGAQSLILNAHSNLILADGINGNATIEGTSFVQNVDQWINEILENYNIRFYDSMSVVHYQKGLEFRIKIDSRTIGSAWDSGWDKYIYQNSGMTYVNTSTTTPYVQ